VGLDALLLTEAQIGAVALGVGDRKQVRRNGRAVVDGKVFADVVAGGPELGLVALGEQDLHARAVGLQHTAIAGARPLGL
jgi:hypothetical protein